MSCILHRILFLTSIITGTLFTVNAADIASAASKRCPQTATAIFDSSFRTLTANIEGDRLAPPILTLDSDDRLIIGFDQLGDERQYLRYSITLCDADWCPSALVDAEVFDGFNYADVENYAFSRATATSYVHYTITLPNNDFQFRLSGNYLLKVYPEEDPENILLQVRFRVSEQALTIGGSVTSRTDAGINNGLQQLSLDIDTRNARIRDPFNDIQVYIYQNNRNDNRVRLSHPNRVVGSRLIYEHTPALIFPAGNEYRRMETVSNLYPGMGEDHIEYHAPYYHHILNLDRPRAAKEYVYDSTQHGRFFIREYSSELSDTEAEYTPVHFTLDHALIPDADIYLDGDFMHRRFTPASKMEYDPSEGRYVKTVMLKQGAYNYQYLTLPHGASVASASEIEGDKYETVNEYLVLVYYRAPGDRYDRLLATTLLFSGK